MSNLLNAQQILSVDDAIIEVHQVPQWGGAVYVKSITAAQRGQIEAEAAHYKESKGKNSSFAEEFTVHMAFLGMCDEAGNRLFTTKEQLAELKKRNAAAIAGVAAHVQRLSGFSKEDIEALEKNSNDAQEDDSLSV